MNKRFFKDIFCPLTKQNCRTDCRWLYMETVFDNDGVEEIINCAVNLIAENIQGEEWEDYA